MHQPINQDKLIRALEDQTPKSGTLWQASQDVVPGGLLSLARKFKPYPFYTDRGDGAYIWDVDGNRYIDCCMSYGVLLLGHRPAVVLEALQAQAERGTTYGTPHPLEIEFAKVFIDCVPCAERMLLCNSGTEATMQAIRVMRAFTGKDRVAKFEGAYHGWHDYASWSIYAHGDTMGPADRPNAVPESAGIPDAIRDTILMLPYNEHAFDLIEEHADELAGVMIEPVFGGGTIPTDKEFLQRLREVTARNGVLLLFDEVITGFRLALGGAQEYYGVLPDLATYGKIIGGGLPVGAVGCSTEMMETVLKGDMSIAVAGTFSGNPFTLAAGTAILSYLRENRSIYDELAAKGDRLRDGFNDWARGEGLPALMTGTSSMFQLHLKDSPIEAPRDMVSRLDEPLADMQLYLRLKGVFIPWLHLAFVSAAHSDEDIEAILAAHQESVAAGLAAHGIG
ncbi:MAG: aspartate aminotransferase family protein [Anaerolineae bacterium]|jgi:glutamate-1-semialdehyde 2,1-aminomutase